MSEDAAVYGAGMPAAAGLEAKAAANMAKWGVQNFETLGLAVAEEAGELAQAILQYLHEGGERDRIMEEAVDLGALCLQVMAHFSVEHGSPSERLGVPPTTPDVDAKVKAAEAAAATAAIQAAQDAPGAAQAPEASTDASVATARATGDPGANTGHQGTTHLVLRTMDGVVGRSESKEE